MAGKTRLSQSVGRLIDAAQATWDAFLVYGPVDNGTPERETLESAFDGLNEARLEAKYDPKSGYCPTLEILVRCRPTPGGRGRNSARWEATTDEYGWGACKSASRREWAIGEVVGRHLAMGEPPARVIVRDVGKEASDG